MKIAVYCGSASGLTPDFMDATRQLGHWLAEAGIDVVYGGGKVGLMGCIADSVLEKNGRVYGVMPEYLVNKEIAHTGLTELTVVSDMHERKARMADMADAFVALPGGAGTLEEIFEVWTWAQLGHHQKPCAFYNTKSFYNPLIEMVSSMVSAGFLKQEYMDMLITVDTPESLLSAIDQYHPPAQKWKK